MGGFNKSPTCTTFNNHWIKQSHRFYHAPFHIILLFFSFPSTFSLTLAHCLHPWVHNVLHHCHRCRLVVGSVFRFPRRRKASRQSTARGFPAPQRCVVSELWSTSPTSIVIAHCSALIRSCCYYLCSFAPRTVPLLFISFTHCHFCLSAIQFLFALRFGLCVKEVV